MAAKKFRFSLKALTSCSRLLLKNWRLTLAGSLALIGIICILVGGYKSSVAYRSRIVDLRMENIGELSTQAAYFTNVQVISDSKELWGVTIPFTQSKYIFSYDGIIKAGINFELITYNINSFEKTITVNLPAAYITSVSIDENSLEVYDESQSIFTPLKLEDFRESRILLEAEAVEQAINNGLLTEATESAKILVQAFLLSSKALTDHSIVWNIADTTQN